MVITIYSQHSLWLALCGGSKIQEVGKTLEPVLDSRHQLNLWKHKHHLLQDFLFIDKTATNNNINNYHIIYPGTVGKHVLLLLCGRQCVLITIRGGGGGGGAYSRDSTVCIYQVPGSLYFAGVFKVVSSKVDSIALGSHTSDLLCLVGSFLSLCVSGRSLFINNFRSVAS